jgi:hypothetical protein
VLNMKMKRRRRAWRNIISRMNDFNNFEFSKIFGKNMTKSLHNL